MCFFKLLTWWCTPSNNESFRLICVSLSNPLVVNEVWKFNRTLGLRPQSCIPRTACSLHDILATTLYWSWKLPLFSVSDKDIMILIVLITSSCSGPSSPSLALFLVALLIYFGLASKYRSLENLIKSLMESSCVTLWPQSFLIFPCTKKVNEAELKINGLMS